LNRAAALEPTNKQILKDLDDIKKVLSALPPVPEQTIPTSGIQEQPQTKLTITKEEKKTATTSSQTTSSTTEEEGDFLLRPAIQKSPTSSSASTTTKETPVKSTITVLPPSEPAKPTAKKTTNVILPRVFNVKPRVPTIAPTTAYEFETTWRYVAKDYFT